MQFKKGFALCLMLLVGVVASTPVSAAKLVIKTQKDPYAVFYPAKSFDWHPLSAVNGKFDPAIRGAIERELAARGFQKATNGRPDFWVGYQFSRVEGMKEVKTGSRGDYTLEQKEYREGTLTVDFFSPDQRRIIIRGWSESVYDPNLSDEEKIKLSDEAIKKIIATLPPPG